jgi:hypothetical protein
VTTQLASFGWPWLILAGALFVAAYALLVSPGNGDRD